MPPAEITVQICTHAIHVKSQCPKDEKEEKRGPQGGGGWKSAFLSHFFFFQLYFASFYLSIPNHEENMAQGLA